LVGGIATLGLAALVASLNRLRWPEPSESVDDLGCWFALPRSALSYFVVEGHSRSPMMPLILFRSRTFSGANFCRCCTLGLGRMPFFFFPFNSSGAGLFGNRCYALLPLILIMFLAHAGQGVSQPI